MSQATFQSPLHDLHEQRGAFFLPYGTDEHHSAVVETFGDLDMEYAALRKGCVIFDEAHMGTIEITGSDRLAFLNNMITAKADDLEPGTNRWSFWLNRKGRIDADLRLAQTTDRMLARIDRHLARSTAATLESFIFAEDAAITDASQTHHRLALHGPQSPALLAAALGPIPALDTLQSNQNITADFQGAPLLIERDDLCAEIGLALTIPTDHTRSLYQTLLNAAQANESLKARPCGWMAINTARIEAGNPLFNLDFGPTNLPVESGIIEQRVNFTKGCYLGQEVVARMHARSACNKKVVALRIEDQRITPEHTQILQPTTGSQVFEAGKETQTPVGVVTSSTISPMLGAIPICFAMVKASHSDPATTLSVSAEGAMVKATVQNNLAFWSKPASNA